MQLIQIFHIEKITIYSKQLYFNAMRKCLVFLLFIFFDESRILEKKVNDSAIRDFIVLKSGPWPVFFFNRDQKLIYQGNPYQAKAP